MAESFRPRYRLSGEDFTIQKFTIGATVVAVGDLVKTDISTGRVVAATTNGVGVTVGVVVGPADHNTDMASLTVNSSEVLVITDADAVYAATDANARKNGAPLDMAGTTGAMSVTTDSNTDLMVVAPSTATQETLFKIAPDTHYLTLT